MLSSVERRAARRRVRRRRGHFALNRQDMLRDSGVESLPLIKNIIVLMMENHSFDNYLGTLGPDRGGFPLGHDGQPSVANSAWDGTVIPVAHLDETQQEDGIPIQTWRSSHQQWNNGGCDGFVWSVEEAKPGRDRTVPMGYWTQEDLPFYHALATTFPLVTTWFSSCLGPTCPNRRFLIAGTANGLVDDLVFGLGDYPKAGTILDLLTAHGISWTNYHHLPSARFRFKRLFTSRGINVGRKLMAAVATLLPTLRSQLQSKLQVTAALFPLGLLRTWNHVKPMSRFWNDVANGTLPAVTIVDPDFGQWSEENPQDIQRGEGFAAMVIDAVMKGPGWPQTVLFWTYDEHGGYFDHVQPPVAQAPDDVQAGTPMDRFLLLRWLKWTPWGAEIEMVDQGPSTYENYGFRVPAVVVSPYSRPNVVLGERPYDHTSILKLIELKWNLPSLTQRDATANAPLEALDFDVAHFLQPPPLPPPAQPFTSWERRERRTQRHATGR